MVKAGGNGDLLVPLNTGGAVLVLGGDGNLAGGANGEDGSLGRVDDGSEVIDSVVHTHVGDGNGATLVLLGLELAFAGLLGQLLDLVGNSLETTALDSSDDGGDETSGGGNSDRHIDSAELANVTLTPARVDLGNLATGDGDSLDEEVVDGQLVLAIGSAVQSLAELAELADGDGAGDVKVRVGLGGLKQAVGNGLAHAGDGDVLVSSAGGSDDGAAEGLLDILLSDLATLAGALEAIDAEAILTGQSLGGGADVGLTVESSLEAASGRVLLRLGGRLGLSGSGRGLRLLFLLGGSGFRGVTTSILDRELLKGGNIGTFLNENSNRL